MESTGTTRMRSRQPPLHTCGVVILSIAHSAYTRSLNFSGPLGSMVRKTARLVELASPLIYALQYHWLAILSFADYLILSIENTVETLFPPSNHVFNKIDKLVQTVETLPGKFDDAMKKLPVIINQGSLLHRALLQVLVWLNFLISTSTHLGFENAKEKEILMDSNSGEPSANQPTFPPGPQSQEAENGKVNDTKKAAMKCTFKEAVENRGKGNGTTKKWIKKNKDVGMTVKETQKQVKCEEERTTSENKLATRRDEKRTEHDPILELFESGWLMKPTRPEGQGNCMSRSVSYT